MGLFDDTFDAIKKSISSQLKFLDPAGVGQTALGLNKFKIPTIKKPKTVEPDMAGAAKAAELKSLAAFGLLDTKKTGAKGLGSAPMANKLYATLLGG